MFINISKILLFTFLCLLITAYSFAQEKSTANLNTTKEIDFSKFFDDINGTAIFYNAKDNYYTVYNKILSEKQSSPCSTFKIFATYVGLTTNTINEENYTRKWNGTIYWNEQWNKDINLDTAFQKSCVWYYRRLINDIGPKTMQEYINKLNYGNKDISDWYGDTDPDNDPKDLKGFWLETSLKISPKEQIQVLNHIFSDKDNITSLAKLKNLMLVYENTTNNLKIYGKTGFGQQNGENTDAWFVGMYELNDKTTYFAVRLDDPLNKNSSSTKAKEIAINIIKTEYNNIK